MYEVPEARQTGGPFLFEPRSDDMEWIGLADYAAHAGMSYNQAFRLALTGKVRAMKVAGRWLVHQSEVQPAAAADGQSR